MLIVDDDEGICEALEDVIRLLGGHSVVSFTNPIKALHYLVAVDRHGLPDLIFLDYNMPQMDGAEFRKQQLSNPRLAHIPAVVCSGADPAELLRAFSGLSVEIHAKPLDTQRILDLVNT